MQILDNQIQAAELIRQKWCITLSETGTIDDLLKPASYVHVAKKMRQGAILEVTAHDGTWWAEVLVRGVVGKDIVLGLLRKVEFGQPEGLDEKEFTVEWGGPKIKWRVVRAIDRVIMADSLPSKEAGYDWIANPPAAASIAA